MEFKGSAEYVRVIQWRQGGGSCVEAPTQPRSPGSDGCARNVCASRSIEARIGGEKFIGRKHDASLETMEEKHRAVGHC